jgi:pheromone shutdown protein TraB
MGLNAVGSSSIISAVRPRIVLVGVGHVFDIKSAVKGIIHQTRPEVVALELDSFRFNSLLSKERGKGGPAPLVYRLLAKFQRDLAEQFGSEAGSEMLAAADAAGEIGARVALIDMEAATVFTRMTKAMSFREKTLMLVGAVMALFTRKATVEKELDRFMSNEDKFMAEIQKVYPSVVRVLIDERNEFMARKLKEISSVSQLTVAVLGDGHVSGMTRMLSEFAEVDVWRLNDLQGMPPTARNSEMTLSFTVDAGNDKT